MRLLLVAFSCACSYAEEKPAVVVNVGNLPADAGNLDVTVTDSANVPKTYHPLTAFADGGVLKLGFPKPAQNGRVDVHVVVPNQGVETTASGLYADPAELDLTARIGFAFHCLAGACPATLNCQKYGTEPGVCTHSCASAGDCESTLPAASCAGFCQWDCSDGGTCPPGLSCVAAGAGKFCSGI